MRKFRILNVAIVLFTALLAVGCEGTSSAGSRAADEAAVRARADQIRAGEAAKKALDTRLKALQLRIEALKTDAGPAQSQSRRTADEEMKKLREEVAELRSKLSNEMGRSEEWDKLKANTEQAFKRLEQKVDDLGRSSK
jgi:chromosome segregation ATPase